jgi:hypothetical protein
MKEEDIANELATWFSNTMSSEDITSQIYLLNDEINLKGKENCALQGLLDIMLKAKKITNPGFLNSGEVVSKKKAKPVKVEFDEDEDDDDEDEEDEEDEEDFDEEDEDPICPNCVKFDKIGLMVVRTNRQTGNKFWGCNNYPKCKYTQPHLESLGGFTKRTSNKNRMEYYSGNPLPGEDFHSPYLDNDYFKEQL